MSKNFIKALKHADSEKLIESAYQRYLIEELKRIGCKVDDFKTSHKTDGLLDGSFEYKGKTLTFKLLLEVKFDEDFTKRTVKTKVLIQTLYYIKTIELAGEHIPDVVVVGDKNECFTLDTSYLIKYLDRDLNWSLAASTAANDRSNVKLFSDIENDSELHGKMHIHYINDNFDLVHIADEIKSITTKEKIKRRITDYNITRIFEYFVMKVLKRKTNGESLYTAREQVEYFMQLVLNNESCYKHPKKKHIAVINDKDITVEADAFETFQDYYIFDDYNAKEKKALTEIADRLIEDSERRMRGDFYTPSIWVDEAHNILSEELGKDWREEYIVWDCAWGTGNLTRDYRFNDLYASTLFQHDIDAGNKYNQNATKFQYDFLNDDVELFEELRLKVEQGHQLTMSDFGGSKLFHKAPLLIQGLLAGKKLLFLINPPYGTASNLNAKKEGGSKEGIAETLINKDMKKNNIGASSQQLYAQFIYRINKLNLLFNNIAYLSIFSPSLFITSGMYKGLRDEISNNMFLLNSFLFKASNFANVSDSWGINFNILKFEKNENIFNIKSNLKDLKNNQIASIGTKFLYNLDSRKTSSDWIKEDLKSIKTKDFVQLSSALNVKQKGRGSLINNSLGYYVNSGNSVYKNQSDVFIVSSCSSMGNGISILPINFKKVTSNYMSRKLINSNWINSKDEYMIPNINHQHYKVWENNSIIFSIFNNASNQSSLRNILYKEKEYDIKNEFFFMSRQEIEDLSLEYRNDDVYEDIELHGQKERYVYEQIQKVLHKMKQAEQSKIILKSIEKGDDFLRNEYNEEQYNELIEQSKYEGFSPKALEVYNKACELVKESFIFRNRFNDEKPEYHINTWDAGWYQIKGILKEYMSDELKEFNQLYKELEDEMRPLVYELGFLYE